MIQITHMYIWIYQKPIIQLEIIPIAYKFCISFTQILKLSVQNCAQATTLHYHPMCNILGQPSHLIATVESYFHKKTISFNFFKFEFTVFSYLVDPKFEFFFHAYIPMYFNKNLYTIL